jgi:hypothetical protein
MDDPDPRCRILLMPRFCLRPGFHRGSDYREPDQEIEAAWFKVDAHRVVSETLSGSSAIAQRLGFIGDRPEIRGIMPLWQRLAS